MERQWRMLRSHLDPEQLPFSGWTTSALSKPLFCEPGALERVAGMLTSVFYE